MFSVVPESQPSTESQRPRVCRVLLRLALIVCAISFRANASPPSSEPKSSGVSEADIDQWIMQLGSTRFRERETATRQLIAAGASAIPALVAATHSNDPEVISRVFSVFESHIDGPLIRPVRAVIDPLATTGNPICRRLARGIAVRDRDNIVKRLKSQGAKVSMQRGLGRVTRMDLDEAWRGKDRDLSDIPRLKDVTVVDCERSTVSDATIEFFAQLPRLQKLYLGRCRVTGVGVKYLVGTNSLIHLSLIDQQLEKETFGYLGELQSVRHLGLDNTPTTDEDLAQLEGLHDLETLWLTKSQVTDEGMSTLSKFKKLRRLVLSGTTIKGPGLAYLAGATQLEDVSFKSVELNGDSIRHLRELKHLHTLGLDDVPVDDEAVAHLRGLTGLRKLWLNGSKATEASIETLTTLTGLQRLYLDKDFFSKTAVEAIQTALPNCKIELD